MPRRASAADRLFALLLHLLPHHLLSKGMYWLARWEWRPFKDAMIRGFIRLYRVDVSEASEPDAGAYPCFNAFFTRALRPAARPFAVDDYTLACPADGSISQIGAIEAGRIFQAKGHRFSVRELLGGDAALAAAFEAGAFVTVYLSPRDYHRVHMPLAGRLTEMTHVPGRLFSVSPSTTRTIPRLFSRNERIVSLFDTPAGPMALVMVGAIFVASMDTVWAGPVTPASRRSTHWHYVETPPEESVALDRGEEMGRFNMGSTVILLFPKGGIEWRESLGPGRSVRMGEALGRITNSRGQAQ